MKAIFALLIILNFIFPQVHAQTREERNELISLVKERQELFDTYAASLKKKSGFFGQKTKNDLRDTHAKLKNIVEMDNRIMSRLRQMLEFRNFERQTMSYDVNQYEEQLKNYERTQDTLVKQLAQLEKEKAALNKSASAFNKWLWFFGGVFVSWLFYYLRRRISR